MMDVVQPKDGLDTEAFKAKQGKVTGIIIPPPEIRAVADKTAQFVARNGKSFEQKILASEEGKTAKFNFMKPFDPYHAYYEFKIREFEEGGIPAAPKAPESTTIKTEPITNGSTIESKTSKTTSTAVRATLISPIAKFAMKKPTSAPSPFEFSLTHPSGLSPLDTDIIKLTAQYTAVNGREFLAGLAQREIRNPQFDFLKPTHLLFSYFTALVDSYAKILHSASELQSRLLVSSDKMKALELAVQRWVWNKEEAERKYRESAEADSEKIAFNSIDWHDFVVVETINFPQDELFDLPIMPTLGAIPSSLPPPALILNTNGRNGTKRFVEDDMDMDMDDDNIHNPPPSPVLSNSKPTEIYIDDDAMDEDDDVALKVVTDYRPRVAGGATGGPMTMRDPLTGKTVSVDVMSEHMRVALLDPKWRIEQQRFQDKQKETGFAEGSSIADNLKQFAKRRGDIFGHKQIGSSSMEEEEEEEKPETIQWDGHQGSIAAAQQLQRELSMRNPQPVPPPPVPVSNIGPALPSLNTAVVQTLPPAPVLATSTIMGIKVPPPPPVPLTPSVVSGLPIPIPIPIIPSVAPIPVIPAPIIPGVIPMPVMPPIIPSVIPGVIPIPSFPVPVGITQAPPSVPSDVPAKKSKPLEVELISAEEFAAQYPSGVNLRITIPNESSGQGASWGLTGQTFTLTIDITTTIRNVKETVATQAKETGNGTETIPVNRFQLKAGAVFLKDASTLAALNIGDGSILELVVKSRR